MIAKRYRAAARFLCAGLFAVAGCREASVPAGGRGRVRVAAAADLNAALGELIARFSATHAVDVSVSFGSSGTFYAQLLNRAPYDLFLSADVAYPRELARRGLTIADGEFVYGVGRMVLWTPVFSALDLEHAGLQALTDASVKHVAIANPEHAPYGRAAVAAMQQAGVYDRVKPKIVVGENVAQALQFVDSGAAEAGIVARSLAVAPALKEKGRWIDIPQLLYPRIEQGGTILRAAADVSSARALRAFMLSAEGRAILTHYGFLLPEA